MVKKRKILIRNNLTEKYLVPDCNPQVDFSEKFYFFHKKFQFFRFFFNFSAGIGLKTYPFVKYRYNTLKPKALGRKPLKINLKMQINPKKSQSWVRQPQCLSIIDEKSLKYVSFY